MLRVARWQSLALSIGWTVLLLCGAAVLGELTVRQRERHRATVPGTVPLLFYRHTRLRHALVRDDDYFGWIHINREGFRGGDVPVGRTPGVARIMVVGSSTTFDPLVSRDAAAWPARLQFWLQQLAPTRPVEVLNAGVPGYIVVDDLIRLETELYRYQPDVVILYEGHNDLFGALRRGVEPRQVDTQTPDEMPSVTPWGHWLSRHSLLYAKIVERLHVIQFGAAGRRAVVATGAAARDGAPAGLDSGAIQFAHAVTAFLAVAQGCGFRVVIPELVHVSGVGVLSEADQQVRQSWIRAMPFATPEGVLQGYARYNAMLRDDARRFHAVWVPTDSFALKGVEFYADGDPIHFNDQGADRMGHRLAEALLAKGVL